MSADFRLEHELTYSAISRLARGRNYKEVAKELLGRPTLTFGGLLPNHGRALQEGLAKRGLRLDDDGLLEGSAYHVLSPFYDEGRRKTLVEAILYDDRPKHNQALQGTSLRYCPACDEEDAKSDRPLCWRTAHHLPGAMACHEHGLQLVPSGSLMELGTMHAPPQSRPAASRKASELEWALARDAVWLHKQQSRLLPGREEVERALLYAIISANVRHAVHYDRLSSEEITASLEKKHPEAYGRLERALKRIGCFAVTDERNRLLRYSVLAQVAGLSLQEIIDRALRAVPETDEVKTSRIIQFAEDRIQASVADNPNASRTDMRKAIPYALYTLNKLAPDRFEAVMPKKSQTVTDAMWADRDDELSMKLGELQKTIDPRTCNNQEQLLAMVGFDWGYYNKNREKLPKTHDRLVELTAWCQEQGAIARAVEEIQRFLKSHPDAKRTDVRKKCDNACRVLSKAAPARYSAIMPIAKHRGRSSGRTR